MPRPRTQKGNKKIETSQRHRVYWHPGEPHPLDVLDEELYSFSPFASLHFSIQTHLVSSDFL